MARCINCAHFPWKVGADFSMMPPMRCVKELQARRWSLETANTEHNCAFFEPLVKPVEPTEIDEEQEIMEEDINEEDTPQEENEEEWMVSDDDTHGGTEEQTEKVIRRAHSRRRKRR